LIAHYVSGGWTFHRELYSVIPAAFRHNFDPQVGLIAAHNVFVHRIWTFSCIRFTDMNGVPEVQKPWHTVDDITSHSDQEFYPANLHTHPNTHDTQTSWQKIALSTPPYYDVGADNYVQTRIQTVGYVRQTVVCRIYSHEMQNWEIGIRSWLSG